MMLLATCRSPDWNSGPLDCQQRTRSLDFVSCIIDSMITWNIAIARSGRRGRRSFFQVGRPLNNKSASLLFYLENWMYLDLQVSPVIGQQWLRIWLLKLFFYYILIRSNKMQQIFLSVLWFRASYINKWKHQLDATVLSVYFTAIVHSTCFGCHIHPSSGASNMYNQVWEMSTRRISWG